MRRLAESLRLRIQIRVGEVDDDANQLGGSWDSVVGPETGGNLELVLWTSGGDGVHFDALCATSEVPDEVRRSLADLRLQDSSTACIAQCQGALKGAARKPLDGHPSRHFATTYQSTQQGDCKGVFLRSGWFGTSWGNAKSALACCRQNGMEFFRAAVQHSAGRKGTKFARDARCPRGTLVGRS